MLSGTDKSDNGPDLKRQGSQKDGSGTVKTQEQETAETPGGGVVTKQNFGGFVSQLTQRVTSGLARRRKSYAEEEQGPAGNVAATDIGAVGGKESPEEKAADALLNEEIPSSSTGPVSTESSDSPAGSEEQLHADIPQVETTEDVQELKQPPKSEHIMFFPNYGWKTVDKAGNEVWRAKVSGWTFSMPPHSTAETILLALLRRAAGVALDSDEHKRLQERADMFFTSSMKRIPMQVDILGMISNGGKAFNATDLVVETETVIQEPLQISSGDKGAWEEQFTINPKDLKDHGQVLEGSHHVVRIKGFHQGMVAPAYGFVDLIEPEGISIITDIDDTIKVTNIPDGKEVILENTFFREATEVTGVSNIYTKLAERGVAFHYVSNGPWQCFPMLQRFFEGYNFPAGSAHLRVINTEDFYTTISAKPGQHKLTQFPKRKFILIGDTGELDLEVYSQVYKLLPDQVLKIFIHDVSSARAVEADKLAQDEKQRKLTHGTYLETLRAAIGADERMKGEGNMAASAVDAVTHTEDSELQRAAMDPKRTTESRLALFEERIKQISEGIRPGVFSLFKDPRVFLEDPVVQAALGNSNK
ncbi:hypothetical protein BZG36_03061 [Bifiguratus adelaidae]|uniref:Phosphatidate phosphatase APP1 catalytic domain-containing protein n=1 Tax=Bifiguratus adelaidae TaxID=1938954 RepID=A0A261XZF5_9FUNG|nr:hypothetical protein BZG36_03061 [Bifiguratus adelaidae]